MGPRNKVQTKKRKMEEEAAAVAAPESESESDSDSSINSSSSETWSELGDRLLGTGTFSTNTNNDDYVDDDDDDDGPPSEVEMDEMDMTQTPLDIKLELVDQAAAPEHFIGHNYDDFMNKLFNSDDEENGESSTSRNASTSRGRGRPRQKGSKPTNSSTDFEQSKRTGKLGKKKIKNNQTVSVVTRSGRQCTQKNNYPDSDDSNPALPGILRIKPRNRRVWSKRAKISRERYISYSNCLNTCNICERSYYSKDHLQQHHEKHLENLICTGFNLGCKHQGKSSKELAQHIRICKWAIQAKEKVMENVQSKPFICIYPLCERTLIDSKGVNKHLRLFHEAKQIQIETGVPTYADFSCICSVCNRKYITEAHLQTHYAKHLDLKCIGINLGCTYISLDIEELKDHLINCPYSAKVQESTLENARIKPYLCFFADCERSFISSKGAMKHIKLFHDLKQQPAIEVNYSDCSFNCNICDRKYFSDDLLKAHYEKHLDLKCSGINLGCSFVSIKFKNKRELKEHLSNCPHAIQVQESTMTNAQVKPYLCLNPDCDRSFISSEGVFKHIKLFHDLKQQPVKEVSYSDCLYTCTICGRKYFTDDHLQTHYQKHLDNLNCIGINLGCLQVFENADHLKCHLNVCSFSIQIIETTASNAQIKPHVCLIPECERSFIDAAGVIRHLRLFHESKCQQPLTYSSCIFVCDLCERKFISQDYLHRHYDKHLDNLICIGGSLGCSQICSSVQELKEHLETCPKSIQLKEKILKNANQKPYLCLFPQCERAFVSLKDGVNRHMRLYHDNNKDTSSIMSEADSIPHLCHICGKVFRKEKSRENHILLIHNESSELCHICGDSVKIRNMKSHMTLKHQSHEFPCTFEGCGKSFKRRYRLNEHSLIHTDNPGFLCIHCGRQYISLKSYNDHMKLHLEDCDFVAKTEFIDFVKSENVEKSPEEIDRLVEQAWYYSPNVFEEGLQQNETPVEKATRMRYETIAMIFRRGLKFPSETIEECYREFRKVRTEKTLRGLIKRRQFETDEEKAARRAKYRRVAQKFRDNNPEKVKEYIKNYNKRKAQRISVDKNSQKYRDYAEKMKEKQRERWSNMSSEKKAQRLEKMKMYQKVRQQQKEFEKYF